MPCWSFLQPVDLSLHGRPRFALADGTLPRLRPVAGFKTSISSLFPNLHFPSGPFDPSGSKRSTRFVTGKLAFRMRPIFLRSPRPIYWNRSHGSTFQIRYASGDLLFLKPLGTVFHNEPILGSRQIECLLWITLSSGKVFFICKYLEGSIGGSAVEKTPAVINVTARASESCPCR